MASWVGKPAIKGRTERIRMLNLTFASLGNSFIWKTEMTYCAPYLLDLGLSHSSMSFVWMAGPITGLIVQPLVGIVSDASTSRWGRRRPLMAAGAVVTALSLLLLGYAKEIVLMFVSDGESARRAAIAVAISAIWIIDSALSVVTSTSRALVVDTLPMEKQQDGSAWYNFMSSTGDVLANMIGSVDLVSLLGLHFGDTQFKKMTILAGLAILSTTGMTCWSVDERVLVAPPLPSLAPSPLHSSFSDNTKRASHLFAPRKQRMGPFHVIGQLQEQIRHLPPRITTICHIQLWAWIGWFPFLFYSSTWVGETYFRHHVPAHARSSPDIVGDMARVGSRALAIYGWITFFGAWVAPLVVQSPADHDKYHPHSQGLGYTPRPPSALAPALDVVRRIKKPHLLTAWIVSNFIFAVAMIFAPFAQSFVVATALICICGIPYAVQHWAPLSFLAVEVSKLGAARPSSRHGGLQAGVELAGLEQLKSLEQQGDGEKASRTTAIPPSPSAVLEKKKGGSELAGIYFGILHIYSTVGQMLSQVICYLVFAALEPKTDKLAQLGNRSGFNAISVCFFVGAICTTVAAVKSKKLWSL